MRTTKFWIITLSALLLLSAAVSFVLLHTRKNAEMVCVYQNGECLYRIDMSAVTESYTLEVTGAYHNILSIEPGRVYVRESDCPDRLCVRQGELGAVPIVCLPNGLVVEWDKTSAVDTVAR